MSGVRSKLVADLGDSQWTIVDDAAERFERAWNAGSDPNLGEFLPADDRAVRLAALVELIKVDQERRGRAGRPKPLECYLEEWPELRQQSEALVDLLQAECRLRASLGTPASRAELQARFPEIHGRIRLDPDRPLAAAAHTPDPAADPTCDPSARRLAHALQVRCPHCRNPIEIVDDTPLAEITCTSCGSKFSLVGDEALAHETIGGTARRRQQFGRFELIEQLGSGGFGAVWKARDTQLDRIVALKIPRKGQLNREETEMFLREARAAAQLRHPGIVTVHEVGIEEGTIYIVSDFIDGLTLAEWLTGKRFGYREAAELCAKIADALHHAHEHGVIHRDLKPNNIMLDVAGEPHLMDFGLAKREAGEVTMTVEGQILGTPAYMSPEQARGEGHTVDRRTDVYSLGVILFQLLTGELPFRGSVRMLIKQVIEDEPPAPRRLNHSVPADLETLCLKCMEKASQRRFRSAQELADELNRFLRGEPIQTRPIGVVGRVWRWYCRNPAAMMAAAGGYATFLNIVLTFWALTGFFVLGLGLHPTENAGCAMLQIACCLVGMFLPGLWLGIRTLNGQVGSLWVSAVFFCLAVVVSLFGLRGRVFEEETFGDVAVRMPLFTLLATVSVLGILVHAVAIVSRYVRHDAG